MGSDSFGVLPRCRLCRTWTWPPATKMPLDLTSCRDRLDKTSPTRLAIQVLVGREHRRGVAVDHGFRQRSSPPPVDRRPLASTMSMVCPGQVRPRAISGGSPSRRRTVERQEPCKTWARLACSFTARAAARAARLLSSSSRLA